MTLPPLEISTSKKKKKSKSDDAPETLKSTARLLTPKERGWTNELEAALQNHRDEIGKLSDFEIAAHAIVAKDNVELALHRIRRLKTFKEKYNLPNDMTVFQAIQLLHKFQHAYPGFIQAIGNDGYNRYTFVFRLSALSSYPPFNHTEEERFAALYFIFHALQPDLDSIRNGCIFVGDLQGITRQYFTLDLFSGGRCLTKDAYPIKIKDFPCISPPPRFSAAYAMCMPFFSATLRQKYVKCHPKLLQTYYSKVLLPQRLGGIMKETEIMELLEENLKKRFENEESFRL
jgi:hypothetical protein